MSERVKHRRRWRWFVAETLNRLPRACWSSLVDWIYGPDIYDDPEERPRLRPFTTDRCRLDAERTGTCYCGKFREEAADA